MQVHTNNYDTEKDTQGCVWTVYSYTATTCMGYAGTGE